MAETSGSYEIRCSVVVHRLHAVLLVHRARDGLDDWVLPGGTPREDESLTACAPVNFSRRPACRRACPRLR
jgi:8-oxo-dGTP pyrophosphatase MutT (NUDIX family)